MAAIAVASFVTVKTLFDTAEEAAALAEGETQEHAILVKTKLARLLTVTVPVVAASAVVAVSEIVMVTEVAPLAVVENVTAGLATATMAGIDPPALISLVFASIAPVPEVIVTSVLAA